LLLRGCFAADAPDRAARDRFIPLRVPAPSALQEAHDCFDESVHPISSLCLASVSTPAMCGECCALLERLALKANFLEDGSL